MNIEEIKEAIQKRDFIKLFRTRQQLDKEIENLDKSIDRVLKHEKHGYVHDLLNRKIEAENAKNLIDYSMSHDEIKREHDLVNKERNN